MYFQFTNPKSSITAIFHRTGAEESQVTVIPNKLTFSQLNQKKSFKVAIQGPPQLLPINQTKSLSASLEWSDESHVDEKSKELKSKEEIIAAKEKVIQEKLDSIASLQSEVPSLQKKER
ncbi:hypothetical protein CFP56_009679 [Quercus suber]|uniref:Subtilisin-like protease fibronectin type-III domain-containing protein n=1 Tax=Quercus suber TaxID=58331 RepID=A0AAW0L1T4_QUESU